MLNKLKDAEIRFITIEEELQKPEIMQDISAYTDLMKEHKNLAPTIEKYREYKKVCEDTEEARLLMEEDPEMREMAARGQKMVAQRFTKEIMCQQTYEVYKKILGE